MEHLVGFIFADYLCFYYLIKHNNVNINIDFAVIHPSQEDCNNDTISRI